MLERCVVGTPPQIHHVPDDVHSLAAATECIELADEYGLELDDSQQTTLLTSLGERRDGSWAASEAADIEGRQAGKNDTINARELAGIHLFDEWLIIHTAHEFSTANESFLRLVAIHENYDDLRKTVERVRYANGEQGIEYLSGQRLKYRARTGGAGRGFAEAALVVYDECQALQPEHLAASFPTMLAQPHFQAWYAGSGGFVTSIPAWRLRRRAIMQEGGRFAYCERTAQIIEIDDEGRFTLVNPAEYELLLDEILETHAAYAAGRVTLETMQTMLRALGPELFGREILCLWEPEPELNTKGAISTTTFAALVDARSLPTANTVRLALDAPHERTTATFSIAGIREDGLRHISVRYDLGPTGEHDQSLRDRVIDIAQKLTAGHDTPLILPPNSPAKAWRRALLESDVPIDELTPSEWQEACGNITDAIADGSLRHRGQQAMTDAVAGLIAKPAGDVDVWTRRGSSSNIAPFVAATAALYRVPAEDVAEPFFVTTR